MIKKPHVLTLFSPKLDIIKYTVNQFHLFIYEVTRIFYEKISGHNIQLVFRNFTVFVIQMTLHAKLVDIYLIEN